MIVALWPAESGHYPLAAYQVAFGISVGFKCITLLWFGWPWLREFGIVFLAALERTQQKTAKREMAFAFASVEGPIVHSHKEADW